MGDFTEPQQKYAGTGENCNIVITVIFYQVNKTNQFLYILFEFVSTVLKALSDFVTQERRNP